MKTKQLAEYLRVHASTVRAAGYLATSGVLEMAASRLEDQRKQIKMQLGNMEQLIENFKTAQRDADEWQTMARERGDKIDLLNTQLESEIGKRADAVAERDSAIRQRDAAFREHYALDGQVRRIILEDSQAPSCWNCGKIKPLADGKPLNCQHCGAVDPLQPRAAAPAPAKPVRPL